MRPAPGFDTQEYFFPNLEEFFSFLELPVFLLFFLRSQFEPQPVFPLRFAPPQSYDKLTSV